MYDIYKGLYRCKEWAFLREEIVETRKVNVKLNLITRVLNWSRYGQALKFSTVTPLEIKDVLIEVVVKMWTLFLWVLLITVLNPRNWTNVELQDDTSDSLSYMHLYIALSQVIVLWNWYDYNLGLLQSSILFTVQHSFLLLKSISYASLKRFEWYRAWRFMILSQWNFHFIIEKLWIFFPTE